MTIRFRVKEVQALWKSCEPPFAKHGTSRYVLTVGPQENGVILDKEGKTRAEAGRGFWPDPKRASRLPDPALQLVGDHGVYLRPNGNFPQPPGEPVDYLRGRYEPRYR